VIQCNRHPSAKMSLCVSPPQTANREKIPVSDGTWSRVCDLFIYWQCRECGCHYAEPKTTIEVESTAATA